MGPGGSKAFFRGQTVFAPPKLTEKTIETTGAGDTFGGCALHFVLQYGLDGLNEDRLHEMLTFANAAASLVTTRKGALCVMPTRRRSGTTWPGTEKEKTIKKPPGCSV